ERQVEALLEFGCYRFCCRDEHVGSFRIGKSRTALAPKEWSWVEALSFVVEHPLDADRDLVLAFEREHEHAAGTRDVEADERPARHHAVGEFERDEGFERAQLSGDHPSADLGDETLHRPRAIIERGLLAVPAERQRLRLLVLPVAGTAALATSFVVLFPPRWLFVTHCCH